MDYARHYNALIVRARHRELSGYSERHHVLPRCLGGGDEPDNIVRLTPEEHYLAHQFLVKMHPGDHRLLWAAMNMTGASAKQAGRRNKVYGWLRRRFGEAMSARNRGRTVSAETRAKISAARSGKGRNPRSATARANISAGNAGKPKSAEHRAALAAAKIGNKNAAGHRVSKEAAARMSEANAGHKRNKCPEYRAKQREHMLRIWAERRSNT